MIIFDFVCSCGGKAEKLVSSDTYEINCTQCGGTAKRVISTPRIALDGTDSSFPGEYQKWERKRKQKMAQEAKQQR